MSVWKCKNCGTLSHIDEISEEDGLCTEHPAGIGNHTFRHHNPQPDNQVSELREMSDRLSEIEADVQTEDSRPDSPSAQIRKAKYSIENAIAELMEAAAKQHGLELVPDSIRVLRERRAA
jgi:hypothetical protein